MCYEASFFRKTRMSIREDGMIIFDGTFCDSKPPVVFDHLRTSSLSDHRKRTIGSIKECSKCELGEAVYSGVPDDTCFTFFNSFNKRYLAPYHVLCSVQG